MTSPSVLFTNYPKMSKKLTSAFVAIQTILVIGSIFFLFALWVPKKSVDTKEKGVKIEADSDQPETWRDFVIKQIGFEIE